jgi:hypothetical protein
MANNYDLGDTVRVAVEFIDVSTGADVDPGQVRVKIKDPQGTVSTFTHPTAEIIRDATGRYRTDVFLSKVGPWLIRWEGRVTNRAAEETTIVAHESEFYDLSGTGL